MSIFASRNFGILKLLENLDIAISSVPFISHCISMYGILEIRWANLLCNRLFFGFFFFLSFRDIPLKNILEREDTFYE